MGESTQKLAEDRTDWAEDRTVMANERTFAGWMRTGLGAAGIAIGLRAVFDATEPTWLAKGAATIFLAIAAGIFMLALRQSRRTLTRLHCHTAEPVSSRWMALVAWSLTIAAGMVTAILWLL